MKIIVIETDKGYNKNGSDAFDNVDISGVKLAADCPRLWMKADSALLKNQKPFFVPEFTNECSAAVYLAVRVCRMGKSIPARFARRYYDAFGVAIDFTAEDLLRELRQNGEPWDLAKSFDSSVAIGDFCEIGDDELLEKLTVSLQINGEEQCVTEVADVKAFVDDAIERLSRIFTVRQGDLLLIGCPQKKPLVKIDDHLVAYLNGEKMTEFNVK